MKQADADREDDVEAPLAEIEVLERRDDEFRLARLDMDGIAAAGRVDHLLRAVDGRQTAAIEALADERGGDPVTAADLQHSVIGPDRELFDDR